MMTADLAPGRWADRAPRTRTLVAGAMGVLGCTRRRSGYDARMRPVIRALAVLIVAVTLLAACGSTGGSGSATASSPVASPATSKPSTTPGPTAPEPTAVPGGKTLPPAPSPTAVTTTRTPWGEILDAVPDTFPVFPDAAIAQSPVEPVSGAWIAQAPVAEVAIWYREAITAAGFASVSLSDPLEDGSRVLDVQGDLPECKAQVTVRPAGGSTMITVLYGSGCAGGGG